MVHYFRAASGVLLYKGRDKFENEDLIRFHHPEDVWFHVDDLSSAHVYLRMPPGMHFEAIPESLLEECCQLVKKNSIEGCKQHEVDVVYTPAFNLKKLAEHDVGQVSFKDEKLVRKIKRVSRNKDILKALESTFLEEYPDLQQQLLQREKQEARARAKAAQEERLRQKEEARAAEQYKQTMSYDRHWDDDLVRSNQDCGDDDDFM